MYTDYSFRSPSHFQVNTASKQLEHTLNDFEQLFLNSRKFILGDNISFADLSAICEIDQPSEYRTEHCKLKLN